MVTPRLGALCLAFALLVGCASQPQQTAAQKVYDAPGGLYRLPLASPAFRGEVTLTDGCDRHGGTLNVWDSTNRFFRIDYLRINDHRLAQVPMFASERIVADLVVNNYLREVLTKAETLKHSQVEVKTFVPTKHGDALLAVAALRLNPDSTELPVELDLESTYYYGFLAFQRNDHAFIVQHTMSSLQPEKMRAHLVALADSLQIPAPEQRETKRRSWLYWLGWGDEPEGCFP